MQPFVSIWLQAQAIELTPYVVGAGLIIAVIYIAAIWNIFVKAGQPGWASLVPFYNLYVMCIIAGRPGWWALLMFIPFVGIIFAILVLVGLADAFGKSAGFAIGLLLLGIVFFPILGFGDAEYKGAPAYPKG